MSVARTICGCLFNRSSVPACQNARSDNNGNAMTDEPALEESQRLQAARDWAYSIQKRFAEELSADIARDARSSDTTAGPHRAAIAKPLAASGLGAEEVEEVMTSNASPQQNEFDEPLFATLSSGTSLTSRRPQNGSAFPPCPEKFFPRRCRPASSTPFVARTHGTPSSTISSLMPT